MRGFRELESAVDGITVFGPIPEEEDAPSDGAWSCEQCGAVVAYEVAAGGVACNHCGHVAPVKGKRVGHAATVNEFTLEELERQQRGWGVERKELHCDNCGADISLSDGALTRTCPFCASNHVAVRTATDDDVRPKYILPVRVDAEEVRRNVHVWLGGGWFHPGRLQQAATEENLVGVYLPYWTFTAHVVADWEGWCGTERTERYYDSESGSYKTRTVIDWEWEEGTVRHDATAGVPGTTRVSNRLLARADDFELSKLEEYEPRYLLGWQATGYDRALPDAWEIGRQEIREDSKARCERAMPGQHHRSFAMAADFEDETWRYLLVPFYISAYEYGGSVYTVVVNGQTGEVAGQKPVAWWRIVVAVSAAMVPGIFVGVCIGFPSILLLGPFALLFFLAGFALCLYAGKWGFDVVKRALEAGRA